MDLFGSAHRRTILLGVCAAAIFFAAAALSYHLFARVTTAPQSSRFSSEYSLTLTDYGGNHVHLYDYARQVLIAYAWASWCPYCSSELADLGKLKQQYGDKIQIVAIDRGESLATAKAFTDAIPGTGGIVFLLDPADSFFKAIGGYAMPEMVFISPSGEIIYHQRGPIDIADVQSKIESLLNGTALTGS